jgi:hypothetical protein
LKEETEDSELKDVSIIAATVGLEGDVCLTAVDFLFRASLGWRGTRAEAVALAKEALALPLVEAGFLVGAMIKDENVWDMRQRKKVKKKKNMQKI